MTRAADELVTRELNGDAATAKPSWSKPEHGLVLDCWRHRYWRDDNESFAHRSINFRILGMGKALAVGHFIEWRGPPISFLDEFFYTADAQSQADHDSADIVRRYWEDGRSPFDYGSVVRFERLAIRASPRASEVWALISELITREFGRRGALLLLKAFPLEYEGTSSADRPEVRQRFRRRAAAMRRYYGRRLGMRPVPGRYGKEGWMWRPLRYCPSPAPKARRVT